MKSLLVLIFLLSQNSIAVPSSMDVGTTSCIDCFNFIAPTVADPTTISTAQVGLIVHDSSEGSFKGYAGAGEWQSLMSFPETVLVKDIKANSTAGGGSTAWAWTTRDLNTLEGTGSFASLASDQVTLQPGSYFVEASAPAYNAIRHMIKLRNVTDNADAILGTIEHPYNSGNVQTRSSLQGFVEITAAKTFEIQHWVQSGVATDGFGTTNNTGGDAVFTQVKIQKIK